MGVLSDTEIEQALASLPNWQRAGQAIERHLEFKDFAEAMKFVNRIAEAAEAANHHPDIDIRYNKVKLGLMSHDSGGVTQRDVKMARKINEVAGS